MTGPIVFDETNIHLIVAGLSHGATGYLFSFKYKGILHGIICWIYHKLKKYIKLEFMHD